MFTPVFNDLLKRQWLATLSELKICGGLAVSELSRRLGTSYMTVKQHCEDLTKLGYLQRSRVPRTEIGRPEIFYRLSEKADALFPSIPVEFTVDLLEQVRQMFGDSAPDKLLFQHFQTQEEQWLARLSKESGRGAKSKALAKLREKEGLFMRCMIDDEAGTITLREFHHPLRHIFQQFPRAIAMEQRALESVLGTRINRVVAEGAGGVPTHVDFVLPLN
ncbi:helix-turn-helix transcriptional regulator [Luteolibacter algae]|uniref:Helix-turn-helix transcriptional regulator n=1 Tax=Luteolibacter algae TaxID=454151 RepID=A0ABW5D9J6_9BACT